METSAEVAAGLIKALDDEYTEVREAASEALGKLGPPAIEELVKAIRYDEGYNILRFIGAAYALAEIGPDALEAVPALLRGLGFRPADADYTDDAAKLRRSAALALGEICSDTSTSRSKAS